MPRDATNSLLELVDEGILDKDIVILACVNWMGEADVEEMCWVNEFLITEEGAEC